MGLVVNCFQIVSLRYWWHQKPVFYPLVLCCELLSDCIFEVLVTPYMPRNEKEDIVVNCFQIVSLRYWWHPDNKYIAHPLGCELLSDCIFEVLVTPNVDEATASLALWIAFRLYLWGIGDTYVIDSARELIVVNCFQIVSLRYWWHLLKYFWQASRRCELLSDCIFEVLVTPEWIKQLGVHGLWIAFRLYLWGIGDT